jgi:hypothetical protein
MAPCSPSPPASRQPRAWILENGVTEGREKLAFPIPSPHAAEAPGLPRKIAPRISHSKRRVEPLSAPLRIAGRHSRP